MPAPPRAWSDPFLEQAREDLRVAWAIPPKHRGSTFCMLLQMIFEKLAKAAYARSGQVVPRTHKAASHLFAVLLRHPTGANILRTSPNVRAFVEQLENAQPSIACLAAQPCEQLEYPWEDPTTGTVFHPEADLGLAKRTRNNPQDRIALDCLRFASAIAQALPTMIP